MTRSLRFLLASIAVGYVSWLLSEAESQLDELEGRLADVEAQLSAARQVRATTEEPS